MTCTIRVLTVLAVLVHVTSGSDLNAQNPGAGREGSGTEPGWTLYVIRNLGAEPASCSLWFHDLSVARLAGSPGFTVPEAGWYVTAMRGDDRLATGLAQLNCSRPVCASMVYSPQAPDASVPGMSKALSSPLSSYAVLPMSFSGAARYGIAIASENDATLPLSLLFTDGAGRVSGRAVHVPPRSQLVGFADQYLGMPETGSGTLEVVSHSGHRFSMVALLFCGGGVTMLLPETPDSLLPENPW